MVVEHAHGLRQRRGPNAKALSRRTSPLMPGCRHRASLSFAQGSHDFESLDRGIGRGIDLKPRTGLISILSFP